MLFDTDTATFIQTNASLAFHVNRLHNGKIIWCKSIIKISTKKKNMEAFEQLVPNSTQLIRFSAKYNNTTL